MVRPNGIGLSPDERTLYVSDTERKHLRAFGVKDDGTVDEGRVLAEMQPWKSGVQGVPDGLVVTSQGHVLVTGPGGVWVFDGKGGRLGVIPTPEPPAACAFGDPDGKTLYITARTRVYRIRMTIGAPVAVAARPGFAEGGSHEGRASRRKPRGGVSGRAG